MTEEKYKKLNNYLNIVFKELENYDNFFLVNLKPIAMIEEKFYSFIKDYKFEEENIENNLTFEDVYKIAREIVENIDKKYLPLYDKIIDDGTIDFNFEKDGSSSWCCTRNNKIIIDIERKFNYNDVKLLVHEFIHYTNSKIGKNTINQYLLSEFLSIYFEIYTQQYLIKNYDAPKESIGIYGRLESTKRMSIYINRYVICLYAYYNSGNLNEKSYEFTNQFYSNESKDKLENACCVVLKNCERVYQNYKYMIYGESEFNEEEFGEYLIGELAIHAHYKYLLGTLLAYYAIDNVDIKNMVALNDFINTEESAQISPISLLYKFGIDIDEFLDKSLESIEKILEDKKKMR